MPELFVECDPTCSSAFPKGKGPHFIVFKACFSRGLWRIRLSTVNKIHPCFPIYSNQISSVVPLSNTSSKWIVSSRIALSHSRVGYPGFHQKRTSCRNECALKADCCLYFFPRYVKPMTYRVNFLVFAQEKIVNVLSRNPRPRIVGLPKAICGSTTISPSLP